MEADRNAESSGPWDMSSRGEDKAQRFGCAEWQVVGYFLLRASSLLDVGPFCLQNGH